TADASAGSCAGSAAGNASAAGRGATPPSPGADGTAAGANESDVLRSAARAVRLDDAGGGVDPARTRSGAVPPAAGDAGAAARGPEPPCTENTEEPAIVATAMSFAVVPPVRNDLAAATTEPRLSFRSVRPTRRLRGVV